MRAQQLVIGELTPVAPTLLMLMSPPPRET